MNYDFLQSKFTTIFNIYFEEFNYLWCGVLHASEIKNKQN